MSLSPSICIKTRNPSNNSNGTNNKRHNAIHQILANHIRMKFKSIFTSRIERRSFNQEIIEKGKHKKFSWILIEAFSQSVIFVVRCCARGMVDHQRIINIFVVGDKCLFVHTWNIVVAMKTCCNQITYQNSSQIILFFSCVVIGRSLFGSFISQLSLPYFLIAYSNSDRKIFKKKKSNRSAWDFDRNDRKLDNKKHT